MKGNAIGEWVKGPLAGTTIEGFIVDETNGTYYIGVKKIYPADSLPPRLTVGVVVDVPKRVIETKYIKLNTEQQHSLIMLARSLKQFDWSFDLMKQFKNPFIPKTPIKQSSIQVIFSSILKKFIKLAKDVREKLLYFYHKSIRKGAIPLFDKPEQIKSAEAFDIIISTIVLASKCMEGVLYIKRMLVEEDIKR